MACANTGSGYGYFGSRLNTPTLLWSPALACANTGSGYGYFGSRLNTPTQRGYFGSRLNTPRHSGPLCGQPSFVFSY